MTRTAELLQTLIRNACVNDGTATSGGEIRSVETIRAFLPDRGHDQISFEPLPGRGSLLASIRGNDPTAPSVTFMGHIDVVAVTEPDRWQHDPFGGELHDEMIWGRGAVDMLDVTATMASAFLKLIEEGFTPRGTLNLLAVADEEALGTHGAEFLCTEHADLVGTDIVLTEFGGMRMPFTQTPVVPVAVGEKGTYWCTIKMKGTPGHASMPLRTDNALVKAAEVVRRLAAYAPDPTLHETWRNFVASANLGEEVEAILTDGPRLEAFLAEAPLPVARLFHACTHTTFAPTIMKAGVKTNIIPDSAEIQVDVRTLPGHEAEQVRAMLAEALGDLWNEVEITADSDSPATISSSSGPALDAIAKVTDSMLPGVGITPTLLTAATDARHFRRIGAQCYGVGLKSDRIGFGDFMAMFHGDDERVDIETLRLEEDYFYRLAHELVG
jgi:acetylornithine deacetylase/succinyl-diaminopimelate desuccinylase-like protein